MAYRTITPANERVLQEVAGQDDAQVGVQGERSAVQLANDSPFRLEGTIITADPQRGKRVAHQIETGMVFINRATWTAPDLPFGGIKNSGYGRELAKLGIGEFVNKKLIRAAYRQTFGGLGPLRNQPPRRPHCRWES
jgi:succinate-semialdehyde dehydrogenase / glutarate-semialdehyde dehydrogenase